jgi:hypothetical protein
MRRKAKLPLAFLRRRVSSGASPLSSVLETKRKTRKKMARRRKRRRRRRKTRSPAVRTSLLLGLLTLSFSFFLKQSQSHCVWLYFERTYAELRASV